jgi:hypothetical protein
MLVRIEGLIEDVELEVARWKERNMARRRSRLNEGITEWVEIKQS